MVIQLPLDDVPRDERMACIVAQWLANTYGCERLVLA